MTQPADDPDLIWHYTSGAGLLGILNSEQPHIFATDALYLNDTRELLLALDHQVALLKQELPADGPQDEHSVRGLFKLWFGDVLENVSPPEGLYVTSFCKHGDLLSQWRGYGTGAGFALGLSRSELTKAAAGGDQLVEVRYGEPDRQFLDHLKPAALHMGARVTFDGDPSAVATLKDPSFSEEAEVRLVARAEDREVHFRPSPRGLVPFLKIDLPLTCVKAVRLSPGQTADTAVRAVERLGAERGIAELVVGHSNIPYRG